MKQGILSNKYYLYMTEFFAGMSVMAVELGASRLLAPYFSSSQIVWTIIIGTIMIAMALGNIWGGRQADRDPNPDRLYRRLFIAAVWIAAIPLLGKYVILGISALLVFTVNSNLLVLAAFFACMVLFVYPLFLLGTVTPSLVKCTVNRLDDSGKIVGALGAFNTIGSILGTFLPTFVTIPAVGTSVTFLIFSGILLVLSLIYFISKKSEKKRCAASVIFFVVCSVFGCSGSFAFWESNLLYEGESVYNYLQVKDTGNKVLFSTNVLFGIQSILVKDKDLTGMYPDYALAAPLMAGVAGRTGEESTEALILGMGTGTYARQCSRYFPNLTIRGVEIDSKITELAYRYFDLPDKVTVTTYDGRAYLQAVETAYDVIMVDAYQDITIPFQMSSVEFFQMVRTHLKEGGVMVVNMNMKSESEGNINEYLADTIADVFPQVYTVDVSGTTNRILYASGKDTMRSNLEEAVRGGFGGNGSSSGQEFLELMKRILNTMEPYRAGGRKLTDDQAPVELLGMRAIDEIIQEEIGYYKDVLQREGVGGLLQ